MTDKTRTSLIQQGAEGVAGADGQNLGRPPGAIIRPEQLQPLPCRQAAHVPCLQPSLAISIFPEYTSLGPLFGRLRRGLRMAGMRLRLVRLCMLRIWVWPGSRLRVRLWWCVVLHCRWLGISSSQLGQGLGVPTPWLRLGRSVLSLCRC